MHGDPQRDPQEAMTELDVRTVARTRVECGRDTEHGLIVRLIATGSGPGSEVIARLPCARLIATRRYAPDWLAEDLALIDTAPTWLRDALEPHPAPRRS